VKEMNKIVQDLKLEIEAIKKIQPEGILEIENLGKRTGTTDTNITNRVQEMEERLSGVEDMIEEIDTPAKENVKSKKFLTQNIQKIWDTMKRSNL
jgi:restriction endonuclease